MKKREREREMGGIHVGWEVKTGVSQCLWWTKHILLMTNGKKNQRSESIMLHVWRPGPAWNTYIYDAIMITRGYTATGEGFVWTSTVYWNNLSLLHVFFQRALKFHQLLGRTVCVKQVEFDVYALYLAANAGGGSEKTLWVFSFVCLEIDLRKAAEVRPHLWTNPLAATPRSTKHWQLLQLQHFLQLAMMSQSYW